MNFSENLSELLRRNSHAFGKIIDADLNAADICRLDFTEANTILQQTDLRDTAEFDKAVQLLLATHQACIGIGGYLETRCIYRRSTHFDLGAEIRNLHLGIDIWMLAGTAVYTPLDATIHSFFDNDNFGDYGPTIILQHELEGFTFYTLFGHLSRTSLKDLQAGKRFSKGDQIATVGTYPENGNWPPHLHFQVMARMEGYYGDFPGVATTAERDKYEHLCPDPNIILQSKHLEV